MTDPRAESTEMKRCEICDWPLMERMEDGCIEGNCSYRAHERTAEYYRIQKRRQDLKEKTEPIPEERAGREATGWRVEISYDADNCQYEAIKGPDGEHIATVQGEALAHKIVNTMNAQLAAQPSVQRDEDGIGWCSSCDKIHEVVRPKCPSCGDWLIFAADDKLEDSAQSFNEGIAAVVAFLEVWNTRGDYIQSAAFFAGKIATLKRITAERGSK